MSELEAIYCHFKEVHINENGEALNIFETLTFAQNHISELLRAKLNNRLYNIE